MMIKRYSQLSRLKTFDERFDYLKIGGAVGVQTFGFDRYLNQAFYTSDAWRAVRDEVIIRDMGCDLGIEGYEIFDHLMIHHMNPVSRQDILNRNPDILDPQYLITVSFSTHQAIHYGSDNKPKLPIERKPGDTLLWKK